MLSFSPLMVYVMLEFLLANLWSLILTLVITILIFVIVRLFKKIKMLTKQNESDHKKLYKNQVTITNELTKLTGILRSIEGSIDKNKNILATKIKTFSDYDNVIASFKREIEAEKEKTKKARGLVSGLMRKLNKINQENNYNRLTNK